MSDQPDYAGAMVAGADILSKHLAAALRQVRQLQQERDDAWERGFRAGEALVTREVEARLASLTEALEDVLDRQGDYPTDLSHDREWTAAFKRAQTALDAAMNQETSQ